MPADVERLGELYDQSAQQLIDAVRPEGYFEGWDERDLKWPHSRPKHGESRAEGLERRSQLVDAIHSGVPRMREDRLCEAHEQFSRLAPSYHQGSQIFLQLRHQFVDRGVGSHQDFLRLYQSLYLEALARGDLYDPDEGEASLERMGVTRVPLSHAQAVAEALSSVVLDDDPRWEDVYTCRIEASTTEAPLRDLLRDVAQRTLDTIAAGGLLATRYNYLNNFAWFGSSVWKVAVDADLVCHRLEAARATEGSEVEAIRLEIRRAEAMLIEFFQAHQEDPSRLRPESYWYGQRYSYLTRDMFDLSVGLVERVNDAVEKAGTPEGCARMSLPPPLSSDKRGRFLDYPNVGKRAGFSPFQRKLRFLRWARACWRVGRRRKRLDRTLTDPAQRRQSAWDQWLDWSRETLAAFDIHLTVTVDPQFHEVARDLDLRVQEQKILFLPAHQGMLEHFAVFSVFSSPEFLGAMGWERPVPFVQLARTGLAHTVSARIGPYRLSIFGISPDTFDRMFVDVDGYVTRESIEASAHTIPKILEAMEERPGLIYPMGTTASFDVQLFPLQHALFAKLPQDIVIIPVAFRGTHSLWPRCPAGNMDISSGAIEAVILPPMLGETALLPKRGSLRVQTEAAALFQAVHIAALFNPEPTD
ncbi:MAG: hypothetical protein QGI83_08970 [Candidatus Latescibacteria bacterium]|nr:hypothetical protein [Candidatus Latescibacterota bacterium]